MQNVKECAKKYFDDLKNGQNNLITCEKLEKELKENEENIFMLDIRKKEDFEQQHIKGATQIDWGLVGDNLDKIPKDKKVVVICYSGQTAGQTTSVLKLLGYNAYSLKCGMVNGWLEEGRELDISNCKSEGDITEPVCDS